MANKNLSQDKQVGSIFRTTYYEKYKMNDFNRDIKESHVKNLMAKFFENFTGELEPSRGQIAGQLQQALKQIPYEKLEPLVIQVALDGQVITRNTLIFAQNRLTEKPKQVTPMRPKFDPAEFENPDAKPMPNNFRDMVKKASEADLSAE